MPLRLPHSWPQPGRVAVPAPEGRTLVAVCLLLAALISALAPRAAAGASAPRAYDVLYRVDFTASPNARNASIRIGDGAENFRELRMDFDPQRFSAFRGDGELEVRDGSLTWRPPRDGGRLSYRAKITNRRRDAGFDARIAESWALFRGDDVFPAAATRTLRGAVSRSRLELALPEGWSSVTRYREGRSGGFAITNDGRGFARPTGWMLTGEIGVRHDTIADRRVAIAAPVGDSFRRMDVMAFLNWTLPRLVAVFPGMDERLLIVGAGDPMWRGGLSGPGSLFVHADRPLISENGTSTFLHELVHVAMGVAGNAHDDWLVEGLAEYYAIRLLRDSGGLSHRRAALSLESVAEWGAGVETLFVDRATGRVTARAVTLLAALDGELREWDPAQDGLDSVLRDLRADDLALGYANLCRAVERRFGKRAGTLDPQAVPGASSIDDCVVPWQRVGLSRPGGSGAPPAPRRPCGRRPRP